MVDGTRLYTIRKGELVRDNINDELKFTDQEIIKVRDRETERGAFSTTEMKKPAPFTLIGPASAGLYLLGQRKIQRCLSGPKASREDIIKDPSLLRLISAHETKCSYESISVM